MKNKNLLTKEFLNRRVVFKNSIERDKFFLLLKEKFNSWKSLREYFGLYKSRMDFFRDGSRSIPYFQFMKFLALLEKRDKRYYLDNIIIKDKNWGQIKAGKITYAKHREIFEKGRRIASNNRIKPVDTNIHITPHICEFIGAFIGDGFMNQYNARYIIEISGDGRLDREYYEETLIPIIKQLSPESKPKIRQYQNNLRLTVYSKGIYKIFTDRLKMKNGKKCYIITIPEEIINSKDYKLINACIRGIFDTDGCVAFDRRKVYKNPYIRIILSMKSLNLIKQVYKILIEQDIKATITHEGETIQINGTEQCRKFIKKIGFSNPRHLNKIKHLL